jgi:AraC-like DNA-binding protein
MRRETQIPLEETLLTDVEVTVRWAVERRWETGDMICHLNRIPTTLTFYLVLQGTLNLTLDGKDFSLQPHEIFIVPPLAARDRIYTPTETTWLSLGLRLCLYQCFDIADLVTEPHYWRTSPETTHKIRTFLETMIQERDEDLWNDRPRLARTNHARGPIEQLISEGLGKAIFGLWWRETNAGGTGAAITQVPAWLLTTLRRMYQEPSLSLQEIQSEAGVSGTYLRRQFHLYFGRTPHSYLTECRLNAGRVLLESTDRTVAAIAADVGFASLSHFTKTFTARFGKSPARHRMDKHLISV